MLIAHMDVLPGYNIYFMFALMEHTIVIPDIIQSWEADVKVLSAVSVQLNLLENVTKG